MEAIGNAKTTPNNSSWRSDKFIELDSNSRIQGAATRTHLLQKSRAVYQSAQERNHRIFYRLRAVSSLPEMSCLQLQHRDHLHYTRQECCPVIGAVDDLADFQETRCAPTLLGFTDDEQPAFRILAAVLHLGSGNIVDAARRVAQGFLPSDAMAHNRRLQMERVSMIRILAWKTNKFEK